MKVSQMYRTALIATMILILSPGLAVRGFAQASSPRGVGNIVLVHGAWADDSCWSRVIALLQAKGFNVVAVQNPLTSLAMMSHPREVAEVIEQAAAKSNK
jgi:pimeloyl-ACP methyl ester carboxylesterase